MKFKFQSTMETTTLEFQHNARTVFSAVCKVFNHKTQFCSINRNDNLFTIEARHGAWLSPFTESIKIKVVATGFKTSRVTIESTSRSILNILNLGANKGNVSDLADYICNQVYRLGQTDDHCTEEGVRMSNPIKFKEPDIKFKDPNIKFKE